MKLISRISAAALLALCATGTDAAQPEPELVIAESARARLTLADYDAELAKLPAASRAEFALSLTRLRQYLDNLYVARALAADARADGLDKDPVIARQISMAVDKMLAQIEVERIEAAAALAFDKSEDKYTARAREMYEVYRSRYAVQERVKAAHILVMIRDGNKDAALARITSIRARLDAGADFSQVAREASDDPLAVHNGGELGWFEAKQMDPAFAAAAFAMTTKGGISAPVQSSFGYHLIRFEDRKPAGFRSFDEVKPELMAELKTKAIADAKADSTRRIFSDPTLKVDVDLINRLNADAVAKSNAAKAATPGKP